MAKTYKREILNYAISRGFNRKIEFELADIKKFIQQLTIDDW